MKKIYSMLLMLVCLFAIVSCDEHKPFPDRGIKIGDILLSDGSTVKPEEYVDSISEAVGVIFRLNDPNEEQGVAFAVALYDLPYRCFADTVGKSLGVSTDIKALNGNSNTYAMFTSTQSPIADELYAIWRYGQSAYLPSAAQMMALGYAKSFINPIIERLGGDVFNDAPSESWYWTSTEVAGQQDYKAWLYSTASGAIHETPKDEPHKARPVITVYY